MDKKIILSVLIVALIGIVAATYQINGGEQTLNPLQSVDTQDSATSDVLSAPVSASAGDSQNALSINNKQQSQSVSGNSPATSNQASSSDNVQSGDTSSSSTSNVNNQGTSNSNPSNTGSNSNNYESSSNTGSNSNNYGSSSNSGTNSGSNTGTTSGTITSSQISLEDAIKAMEANTPGYSCKNSKINTINGTKYYSITLESKTDPTDEVNYVTKWNSQKKKFDIEEGVGNHEVPDNASDVGRLNSSDTGNTSGYSSSTIDTTNDNASNGTY